MSNSAVATRLGRFRFAFVLTTLVAPALASAGQVSTQPSDQIITVAPGARIAWTQEGDTSSDLLSFTLAVDGSRSSLADVECTPTGWGSVCSAPLPRLSVGTHAVELTAVSPTGPESATSAPLRILVKSSVGVNGSGLPLTATTTSRSQAAAQPLAFQTCAAGGDLCYDAAVVATGRARVARIAALPDGRALLVPQSGRSIVLLSNDAAEVAYNLDDDLPNAASVVDVVADQAFPRNRFVYAAVLSPADAAASVQVLRLREVGGRLGEPATIVPAVPTASDTTASLAMSADGTLHLTLTRPATRAAAASSVLMNFSRDGQPGGSTIDTPLQQLRTGDGGQSIRALAFISTEEALAIAGAPASVHVLQIGPASRVVDRGALAIGEREPTALAVAGADVLIAAAEADGRTAILRLRIHARR